MPCQTCGSTRLGQMVLLHSELRADGVICFNCGQMQGKFPLLESKVPVGSLLGEAVNTLRPGEKGKFRLLNHLTGKKIEYTRLDEVETFWRGQEPIAENAVVELTFFTEDNPLSDLHVDLIGALKPHQPEEAVPDTDWLVQQLLMQASPDQVVIMGDDQPWMGKICLVISSHEFLVRDDDGVSHEVQKSQIMTEVQPLLT